MNPWKKFCLRFARAVASLKLSRFATLSGSVELETVLLVQRRRLGSGSRSFQRCPDPLPDPTSILIFLLWVTKVRALHKSGVTPPWIWAAGVPGTPVPMCAPAACLDFPLFKRVRCIACNWFLQHSKIRLTLDASGVKSPRSYPTHDAVSFDLKTPHFALAPSEIHISTVEKKLTANNAVRIAGSIQVDPHGEGLNLIEVRFSTNRSDVPPITGIRVTAALRATGTDPKWD